MISLLNRQMCTPNRRKSLTKRCLRTICIEIKQKYLFASITFVCDRCFVFIYYSPTNSANSAFGRRCFFDANSLIPSVYLNDEPISKRRKKMRRRRNQYKNTYILCKQNFNRRRIQQYHSLLKHRT